MTRKAFLMLSIGPFRDGGWEAGGGGVLMAIMARWQREVKVAGSARLLMMDIAGKGGY